MATAVRGALEEVGLDVEWCDEALSDPGTWEAVLDEHHGLIERTRSFGVPTIVLDGGTGPAIFGPVISELPSDEDAVDLWRHVSWLARYDNFAELKRDRIKSPDLPAMTWYRAQREADQSTESVGEPIFVRRDRRREEPARPASGLVGSKQPKGRSRYER